MLIISTWVWGKTLIGSEKAYSLGLKTLIVCQKSKINDWILHLKNQYNIGPLNLTLKCDLTAFLEQDHNFIYTSQENAREGSNSLLKTILVGVINYDLVWRRPEFANLANFTLVLDESSLIQHQTTKRTKFILNLRATNVILLSGTPVSGRFENLWSQARLLGWNITAYQYGQRFVNWERIRVGPFFRNIVDRKNPYKNTEELKDTLRRYGAVFLKSDEVLDLPEQNFQTIKISPSKDYYTFLKDRYISINTKDIVGDTTLNFYLGKRQLCSFYNKDKIEALKDLIDSTSGRIIVFYNWNDELKAFIHFIKGRPISQINGRIKDLTNYETEENSITYIQYQAGALGLNLQKANKIIYFTPTDKSELFEQSKKRIHRIGQHNPCFYYELVVEHSIEEDIYKSLALHKDYTDYLFI